LISKNGRQHLKIDQTELLEQFLSTKRPMVQPLQVLFIGLAIGVGVLASTMS